jgi:alpha-N-arabinofuranosidase
LVCYQKESFNYVFGITKMDKDFYVVLERTARGKSAVIASQKISLDGPVQLQVKAVGDKYQFAYALNQGDFVNLAAPCRAIFFLPMWQEDLPAA